ncbi:MAG: SurA N-terminal domain-containing protein [Rhodanobacter sp.]
MLQAMRNKMHGWPATILLGVSVFAMSFFGIESYFTSHEDSFVAKVGKREISQQDMQNAMNRVRENMQSREGDHFDSSALEKPAFKLGVVNQLVDEQLLLQANDDWGLRVSRQAMQSTISGFAWLQVNGQFDATAYSAWLESQRKTPAMFEDDVRASLAPQLLPDAISASTVVSDAQVDRYLALYTQRRDVSYFQIPKPTLADSQISDAEVQSWYKAHIADYMNPEQVSLKYVEVNGADLKLEATPSDEDLKKRYDDEKQKFVQPEQRLVSHILVNVPTNATPVQQKAALAKAEKIAAEATPADFAKLAGEDSEDLGSKRQGGDLGWLEKGVTNPAFETAMFALQKGQVSKPILSPDGYHIIWLRDIRSGESKPFADVRADLLKEATTADLERQYNDAAGKMSDNTYQNPSSLEPASQKLGLPIKSTGLFSRKGGEGLAADPKVIAAAFGDDVLVQGNNSGLIDLGNNHSVVIRVDKHVAAAARSLAEVGDDVKKHILDERVSAQEKKLADDSLLRLAKGETMAVVAKSLNAPVKTTPEATRQSVEVPPALLTQAFLLPHPAADKPQFAVVDLHDGNYALLAVDKVQSGDLSKVPQDQRDALRKQMTQAYAFETQRELLQLLRGKSKVKINNSML